MKRLLLSLSLAVLTAAGALAADAPAPLKVSDFTFQPAAPWVAKAEPRQMSAGGYTLPAKEGEAAVEMDFFHFGPGAGGGVEANIQRWENQFQPAAEAQKVEAAREELTLGKTKVILVTIKGTFLSGPMFGAKKTPMEGYQMIGAIVQSEAGDIFVKVIGPEAAVAAAGPDVKKLLEAACGAGK